MILIPYILSIIFDAWADGWRSRSKEWHIQQALMVLALICSAMFYDHGLSLWILVYIFVYGLLRFALFDDLTNIFARRKFGYTGKTWWDRQVAKAPIFLRIFFRAIALFTGIMITIQIL